MLTSLSLTIGRRFSQARQRNKMVSFISLSSMLGIMVGVAVIIIGLSAMNGFERELENRVLSVIPHAELEGINAPIENWAKMVEDAKRHEQVLAAAPYVRMTALAERGSKLKALEVRGVDRDLESQVSALPKFIDSSAWNNFNSGVGQVILGQGVAKELGAQVGDSITLLLPTFGAGNQVKAPKRIRVKVTGLLKLSGQIDHNLALIPLGDAQQYQGIGERVTGVSLKVDDVLNAQSIVRMVGSYVSEYVYLRSWKQKFGYLHRDIQLVRTIMYLVMVLVIGVACFNIVSTLMMAVKDRASEIAILRTMGATDGLIKRIFVWQGVFSGVVGSMVGSVIGTLVALNLTPIISALETLIGHQFLSGDIYFVDFLPSLLHPMDVVVVSGTAVGLSLLATWYPASKASKMNPASVLSAK